MATKSYSEHKEYKKFKSSGNAPFTSEQFDMIKSDLPKSKLESLNNGHREYQYEYKEEKHPSGKYDRKDLRTVEEYTVPPKNKPKSKESSAYYYEREERELPAISTSNRSYNYESNTSATPGYSKVKTTKATKDLAHNVEELDSLLEDLQKDQERQLYKSGYTSDTAESTSFDYRRGTPVKAPSSGYSTLKKEERVESSSWGVSPPPALPAHSRAEVRREEMYKEEKIGGYTSDTAESSTYDYKRTLANPPSSGYSTLKKEERLESSSWGASPPPVTRSTELRQEMFKEEKHESRIIPSQISPAIPHAVPAPLCANCHQPPTGTLTRGGPMNKVTTTVKTYTYEVPADQDPTSIPIPTTTEHKYLSSTDKISSSTTAVPPSPSLGCQYDNHCSSRVTRHVTHPAPVTVTDFHHSTTDLRDERIIYPQPANQVKLVPSGEPNGHGPYGSHYKYSETVYSSENNHSVPGAAFPRPATPSAGTQQPPKKLDDLLADFPDARFPTQPDGVVHRKIETRLESSKQESAVKTPSNNVAGPPVYYPPNHTPFAKQTHAELQGGGAYATGKGMYEYESGAKMKEKHTEKKTAVPVCLPLCCAMPCTIM